MNFIGNRLKELRESLGYNSVDEFAKIIGIHRSSLYRYEGTNEAEKREIPISAAIAISQKFGISLDWLAGLSDVKYMDQGSNELTKIYESLPEKKQSELFSYAVYLKNKGDEAK